jgi:hypothetical protein
MFEQVWITISSDAMARFHLILAATLCTVVMIFLPSLSLQAPIMP